jgi:hypothetical protein
MGFPWTFALFSFLLLDKVFPFAIGKLLKKRKTNQGIIVCQADVRRLCGPQSNDMLVSLPPQQFQPVLINIIVMISENT